MTFDAAQFWNCLEGATSEGLADHENKVIRFSKNDKTWYLKQRASYALCENDLRVANLCKEARFPAAQPLPTDDGQTTVNQDGLWWVLAQGLPGEVLTDLAKEKSSWLGAAIAGFHTVMSNADQSLFPDYDSALTSLMVRLERLADRETETDRLLSIFEGFQNEDSLTTGIVHRDPHPGNMCFRNGELAGFLDFDLVRRGPLLFDPCYCANSQLANFWTREYEPDRWLDILTGIMDGYFDTARPRIDERAHVYEMLLKAQLTFLVWLRETGQDETAEHNKQQLLWMADKRGLIERRLGL